MLTPARMFDGMVQGTRRLIGGRGLLAVGVLLILLAAACSSDSTSSTTTSQQVGSDEPQPSEEPQFGGPDFSAILISSDMAVGENRLIFLLIDRENMPVRSAKAEVRAYLQVPREDAEELKATGTAHFVPWPGREQGTFVVNLDLDIGGLYRIEIDTTRDDGAPVRAETNMILKDVSDTPTVGAPAPASVTKTASDVEDLRHISTSPIPDPDLYQISIDEAVSDAKPFVVVFATPAFCGSATCGPQVGELSKVKAELAGQANFIHVEVFNDPHLIEGARPAGGLVQAVKDWDLPSEPWTFVVDAQGLVSAKFEGFTPAEVIEAALREVLR